MFLTHKVLLKWLMYATATLSAAAAFLHFGIPQLVFHHDHVYLTSVLLLMYLVAEIVAGREAIRLSRELRLTEHVLSWLARSGTAVAFRSDNDSVEIATDDPVGTRVLTVPDSFLGLHLGHLIRRAALSPGTRIDQTLLLDALADRIEFRTRIGSFIGSLIVWVGILATILGVVLAFWPFMQAGLDIEAMKRNLGGFFAGIAVAFLPTAASFVFKIALDINDRILAAGVTDLIDNITTISETYAAPALENPDAEG
jgi:hypothetical protein